MHGAVSGVGQLRGWSEVITWWSAQGTSCSADLYHSELGAVSALRVVAVPTKNNFEIGVE